MSDNSNKKLRIDPVAAAQAPSAQKSSIVRDILAPLGGNIADSIQALATARVEMERLKTERHRVTEQAKIAHHAIDAAYSIEMAKLGAIRSALSRAFDLVEKSLDQKHVERMELLRGITDLTKAVANPNLSAENKAECRQAMDVLRLLMSDAGGHAVASLQEAIKATQKAIEGVPMSRALLADDGSEAS